MVNLPGSISLAQTPWPKLPGHTPWPKLLGANLAWAARVCVGQRRSVRAALEQLDRHSLRTAQEGDAHPWPDGGGLHCELGALGLELGHDGIDFRHRQPAMVEALIGSLRWWIDFGVRQDLGHENVGATDLEIDARLALLQRADHLSAKHARVECGCRLKIGAAQVNVVVCELGHAVLPRCDKSPHRRALSRTAPLGCGAPHTAARRGCSGRPR